MNQYTVKHEVDGIDPDALTTDPEVRVRRSSMELHAARSDAEKAGAIYVRAVRKMRAAEIQLARAVNERRRKTISG